VAFAEKRRDGPETQLLGIIGDVKGKDAILVDDEVDQGTTIADAAKGLREAGARDVYACFVHATFSDGAMQRLAEADFREIVFTDTERIHQEKLLPNMTVISVGDYLARIIEAVHWGLSVGQTVSEYEPMY